MGTTDPQILAKSRESGKKAKQLPDGVQYAIVQIMPNILNGCFWGFADLENVSQHIEVIKNDKNIIAHKLSNAALLEVTPAYLLQAINIIDPNAITNKDMEVMNKARIEAVAEFQAFLIRMGKKPEGYQGKIGIYCVNDVNTIAYQGTKFPAFRVDINTCLQQLSNFGYFVNIGGQYVSASQAGNAGQKLWDNITLSPTKTGVFVDIRYTGTPDQMKALEKQMKNKQ